MTPSPPDPGDASAPVAAPTRSRHPGGGTRVRCTFCDRPICPDCMRPAAVGFQCPECVSSGGRTVRTARTVFGGRATQSGPVVTYAIIAINVVVFLLQQANSQVTIDYGNIPLAVADGDYHRLITA